MSEKSQADTPFRKKMKTLVENFFSINEHGTQEIEIRQRGREERVLARRVTGVVYGDGGPYIECEQDDLEIDNFPISEHHFYFNQLFTSDRKVKVYIQKRTVSDRPNPPHSATYRDPQNRPTGYADYKIGKAYFNPDEIVVKKGQEASKPSPQHTLRAFINVERTEEEKKRERTLVFFHATHESELDFVNHMIESKIIEHENEAGIRSFHKRTAKQGSRIRLVKVEFCDSVKANKIFDLRARLQVSGINVARDTSLEEREAKRREKKTNQREATGRQSYRDYERPWLPRTHSTMTFPPARAFSRSSPPPLPDLLPRATQAHPSRLPSRLLPEPYPGPPHLPSQPLSPEQPIH
ncbi:MAG: hypothetical protein ACRDUT_17305, partial [Mycobacterium sp.]